MVTRLASGHSPKRQVDLSQIRRPRGSAPDCERLQSLDTDVRCPTVDGGVYQTLDLERVLVDDGLDLRLVLDAQEQGAPFPGDEGSGRDQLSLGEQFTQVGAVAV